MDAQKRAVGGAGGPPAKRFAGGGGGGGPGSGGSGHSQQQHPQRHSGMEEDEMIDEMIEDELGAGDDDYDGPPQPDEDVELNVGEAGRNWKRPAPATLDPKADIVFQQLEVDYFVAQVSELDRKPNGVTQAPVLRMYGVNDAGNSVCAFVHGFESYFFIEVPGRGDFGPEDVETLQQVLNERLRDKAKNVGPAVLRIERHNDKRSIWGFQAPGQGGGRGFLKIVTCLPNLVAPARSMLEGGISTPHLSVPACTTYESNVLFPLRFMSDMRMGGGSWVTLKGGAWRTHLKPQTYCQIEAHVHYKDIIAHPSEGEWSRVAPFRVLSVDIECAGRKGCFPDAKQDPVIQIASMVTLQGQSSPIVRNVMTLGTCASIVGSEVMCFDDERDLLQRWRDLLLDTDPDVIIGYNIINFDLPYLFDRGKALGIDNLFNFWGRLRGSKTRMRDTQFSSKAYGTHEYKEISIEGRVQFDLLVAIQREHKLASYSLNAVSAHFLNEQKEDVHHSCITDLQNGNEETRRRLAVYCLKDAYLPQRLLDKLMLMYNNIEMARVTGVPMSYLLTKGQSIKVYSQLLRKANSRNFLLPNVKSQGAPSDAVGYEGATVLEPKMGFYDQPVATLDFASLYPSIMMAHNLCYSTLVTGDRARELPPEQVAQSPSGDWFVKSGVVKGVLPEILEELLAARKRAKADLKAEKDPFKRAVLDGRQLALKVSANSVYGFTGATVGKMPCLAISASTTAYGRTMIMHTRELVMRTYTRANGYEADCEVIYGDTDSVMVNFKVSDVKRAMELGKHAADFVSTTFVRPVKLEFEKVYFPYLLMNKKRYAGLLWTNPDKHDKMDAKGIETVRRDNCLLVRNVVSACLEHILIKRDVEGAVTYVKGVISELLQNRIDLSLLVISKSLTKDADDYDNASAHVMLARKMKKRDPATAPQVGDRVPYVIIKAAKGAKAYEKAEDPIFALENNLPIDTTHYLEHHLSQPLLRIFEPVMKNPKELLTGDHTRCITVSTPSSTTGGIMRFAKIKLSCLGCKAPLTKPGETSLCEHCRPKEADIYRKTLGAATALEESYAALWSQCQRCQGSLHLDVLCSSRDCPIFYRRKKVQKDLNEAQTALARFDQDW